MEIKLLTNNSELYELNKNLSNEQSFECVLKKPTSVTEPILLLTIESNPSQYNYCYIPEFKRYYYINDIISFRNNFWEIHCRVDVLMSFKDSILSSYAILDESTKTGVNNYLSNDVWNSMVKDKTTIIQFQKGLSENGEYILITAGG